MTLSRFLALPLAASFACGCAFERHYSIEPGVSQVVEVESGDRWYFTLNEDSASDHEWTYTCDDDDVEVRIDHSPGKAKVLIRIHRGYDGPSTVRFFCQDPKGGADAAKSFAITLFKRTGDEAFWK